MMPGNPPAREALVIGQFLSGDTVDGQKNLHHFYTMGHNF